VEQSRYIRKKNKKELSEENKEHNMWNKDSREKGI
jgi:hypothetical protein